MKETALQGLHAVVTGGGSGIGAAIAHELVAAGASVSLLGRNVERLQEQAGMLGTLGRVDWHEVDVGDEASVQRAFGQCGPVDILVNNAGVAETAPFQRMDLGTWQRLLQVNLTGTFLCCREAAPGMTERGFGRIINVASTAALTGYAYAAAYCASKHGVLGLTRAMALEMARKGVTVNAVCPGYTETALVERSIGTIVAKTGRTPAEARRQLAQANPQGRLVQPQEVASTVCWLARRGSGSVNGQAIAVCGGETMC